MRYSTKMFAAILFFVVFLAACSASQQEGDAATYGATVDGEAAQTESQAPDAPGAPPNLEEQPLVSNDTTPLGEGPHDDVFVSATLTPRYAPDGKQNITITIRGEVPKSMQGFTKTDVSETITGFYSHVPDGENTRYYADWTLPQPAEVRTTAFTATWADGTIRRMTVDWTTCEDPCIITEATVAKELPRPTSRKPKPLPAALPDARKFNSTTDKIIGATISPYDVHPGEQQNLTVVVQGPEPLLVWATTQTDTQNRTFGFAKMYTVDWGDALEHYYFSSWNVNDTHSEIYNTTFFVMFPDGTILNSTVVWTDLCSIPINGAWTIGAACTITTTVEGVDNGNATISGGYTLAVSGASARFVFNPGKKITISGANSKITVGSGGKVLQTYLWGKNSDGDGYISTYLAQDTSPGGSYARKYTLGGSEGDCCDSDANAYPGQSSWFTTTRTTCGGYDFNCDGSENQQYPSEGYLACGYSTCSSVLSFTAGYGWTCYDPGASTIYQCSGFGWVPGCASTALYWTTASCSGSWPSCSVSGSSFSATQACH
jgi:hypothetical protein